MTTPSNRGGAGLGLLILGLALGAGGGWYFAGGRGGAPVAADDHGSRAASAPAAERQVLYWYDPMVPTQKFDKPGKSPFMDMQLVPRYADEAAAPGATPDSAPALPAAAPASASSA